MGCNEINTDHQDIEDIFQMLECIFGQRHDESTEDDQFQTALIDSINTNDLDNLSNNKTISIQNSFNSTLTGSSESSVVADLDPQNIPSFASTPKKLNSNSFPNSCIDETVNDIGIPHHLVKNPNGNSLVKTETKTKNKTRKRLPKVKEKLEPTRHSRRIQGKKPDCLDSIK